MTTNYGIKKLASLAEQTALTGINARTDLSGLRGNALLFRLATETAAFSLRFVIYRTAEGLRVVGSLVCWTFRGAENITQDRPVFIRVKFFAAHAGQLLDQRALAGVTYDRELQPMRNRLLRDPDHSGEVGLRARDLDRAFDSALFVGWCAHHAFVSDYKRICSTGCEALQAHLKALDTKSFV